MVVGMLRLLPSLQCQRQHQFRGKQTVAPFQFQYSRTVLPNLCAAAHKCAARAVEVCRGQMSEINTFQ